MTTRSATQEKALRLASGEVEAIGFDLDRNDEERLELLRRREAAIKLYQMLGGEPAPYKPRRTTNVDE